MDPFLIKEVLDAKYFRGEIDAKGRPRKIKGYEKNVLLVIAANTESYIDLSVSLVKSSMKAQWVDGYGAEEPILRRLSKLLTREGKINCVVIALQCSMTYRRVLSIVLGLRRIDVLRGYVINRQKLATTEKE